MNRINLVSKEIKAYEYPGVSVVLFDVVQINMNEEDTHSIIDLAVSPGEDVFLVVYASNTMALFAENEFQSKMMFAS